MEYSLGISSIGRLIIADHVDMPNNRSIWHKSTAGVNYRTILRGNDDWVHVNPETYGRTQIHGSLEVTNLNVSSNKNAIHVTRDGVRATPAYETAESYLGDIGTDVSGVESRVVIPIETLFGDTINTAVEYQVFLQAYGNGNVWVSERNLDHFIVESSVPNLKFGWEIKAKRKGYENDRLVLQEDYTNDVIKTNEGFCGEYAVVPEFEETP